MFTWLFPYDGAVLWLYFGVLVALLLCYTYRLVTRGGAAASFTVMGLRNRKGLDKKVLASFPVFTYRTSVHGGRGGLGLDECPICCDDYIDGAWFCLFTSCRYCRRIFATSCQS